MKYSQTSLAQLTSVLTEDERKAIKKITTQFIVRHASFGLVRKTLCNEKKEKTLYIIIDVRGIIPYEEIVSVDSLDSTPEANFFF